MGNQESQARLIKLWAAAAQDRSGTQDPLKLLRPVHLQGPSTGQALVCTHAAWGTLFPNEAKCGISPLLPAAPLPSCRRPSALARACRPAPNTGSQMWGHQGIPGKGGEEQGLSRQRPQGIKRPLGPSPHLEKRRNCPTTALAPQVPRFVSQVPETRVQITAGPPTVPVQVRVGGRSYLRASLSLGVNRQQRCLTRGGWAVTGGG